MRRILALAAAAVAGIGICVATAPAHAGSTDQSWARYVVAPSSRDVQPVRVIATTGDVTNPDGTLGHGTATTLSRPQPPAPPSWPSGTSATASSYHAPNNGDNGQPRTYVPQNAIDGNTDTFWNDATPATYPAVLTVTAPQPVTLPGITVLSNSDGVPVDYTVATWDGTNWVPRPR